MRYVLVVEDDDDLRAILVELFSPIESPAAWDVDSALDQVRMRSGPPSVIVTDFHLAGVRGSEVVSALRRHFQFEIPAVFVTGSDFPPLAMSASHVVLKPFDAMALRALVLTLSGAAARDSGPT